MLHFVQFWQQGAGSLDFCEDLTRKGDGFRDAVFVDVLQALQFPQGSTDSQTLLLAGAAPAP